MSKPSWNPWHQVVQLREDLRTGELALNEFAADIYDVALRSGKRRIYEDPKEFFALTYPTSALLDLARDVVRRLAGKNQKAVRQLELTYGGGKTHTLITLFHLVTDPASLPQLPAVDEFKARIDLPLPPTRVAVLPFDKFDAEKGTEVRDPSGDRRMLRQPWSALAWQLAGADGLRILHPDDKPEERRTAPAENLLTLLLETPQKDGRSTLILMDEVLMFAHAAVDADPAWRERLKNFFQALTQAATKVDRCAIVASLLATDVAKNDELGRAITDELYAIFRREREEGVEPVSKKDVAEVLRRRFFTPESLQTKEAFRKPVIEALNGIEVLDDETKKSRKDEEVRFVASYPFHPDLTEVLYAKWTQLQGFQRTRGVLRTFALALREAEKWDTSPVVGPNVFLAAPTEDGLSEAARELTQVATVEEHEGKKQEWSSILAGELEKARRVQQELSDLQHREVEQAVLATFLHSQPPGARAQLRELLVLVGATRPDKITLQKALREWFDRSWFLDEAADADTRATNGVKSPPAVWRLGSRPNLKQMHADAVTRVADQTVEEHLLGAIRKNKTLTATASQAGARVHNLPERPGMVDDDGQFRYVVLGPSAASESGKPSAEARRFIEETTAADRPRTERNAIVLAVPSREGVYIARTAVRDYLGWLAVDDALKKEGHELDLVRQQNLDSYRNAALKRIGDAIQQAYCIVVTVSSDNDVQAFRVQVSDAPLFNTIKADSRSRIQESAISPDAVLPGGPYQLWRDDEESRPVRDLVGAFARFPHLPKMLNRQAIVDTIIRGCEEGYFVARLTRPDKSIQTWWRQAPPSDVLDDPQLDLVLPDKAELVNLSPNILRPGMIDDLWRMPQVTVATIRTFFDGAHTITVSRGGYDEPMPVPRVLADVVDGALRAAVKEGWLWLTSGPASLLGEDVPPALVTADTVLQAPPDPISPLDLLPNSLTDAWQSGRSDAMSVAVALSKKVGGTLPWLTVREAIDAAFRARVLDRGPGSVDWPCDYSNASAVSIVVPEPGSVAATLPPAAASDTRTSAATALKPNQLQDLVDVLPDLIKMTAGHELRFRLAVEIKGKQRPHDKLVAAVNELFKDLDDELRIQ
ncbi:MAG: DUF499 domain-containing protein [Luteitalea sp.]|nr:DUF499 domain-containing protein [Luteitalea sp.]